ncbi:MAG: hypothetical protein K0S10_1049 [Rubrobacteraceae bacterium]|nr:hypothetical protein [Rubrobacteraceae bacterium]
MKTRAAERQYEPRAYRESIAQVFRQLRPNVKVITAETHELKERVIFSEATGLLRERVPVRVELYPGYVPRSVTGVVEERSAIEEFTALGGRPRGAASPIRLEKDHLYW